MHGCVYQQRKSDRSQGGCDLVAVFCQVCSIQTRRRQKKSNKTKKKERKKKKKTTKKTKQKHQTQTLNEEWFYAHRRQTRSLSCFFLPLIDSLVFITLTSASVSVASPTRLRSFLAMWTVSTHTHVVKRGQCSNGRGDMITGPLPHITHTHAYHQPELIVKRLQQYA